MTKTPDRTKEKEAMNRVIDLIQGLIKDYEPRIKKLEDLELEVRDMTDKSPNKDNLALHVQILDDLIATRTEYRRRLNALMAVLVEAADKFCSVGVIDFPGTYYKAPHNSEIKEVYDLIINPAKAMFDPDADKDHKFRSHALTRKGEVLTIVWGDGKLTQEGIMLPQFIRKLWLRDPKADQVRFNIRDYMKLRGLKNATQTYEIMNRELLKLVGIRIYYTLNEKTRGGYGFVGTHLKEGGEVLLTLTKETISMFESAGKQFHLYPDALFKINMQYNPLSWGLGMYFADQKSCFWKQWPGDEMVFPNLALLDVSGLSESAVRAGGRHYVKEIIRKIERDLDALSESYNWQYYPQGGKEWSEGWKAWKAGQVKIKFIASPYDSFDKQAALELDQKKRESRILEAEKQKVKQKAGKR